MLVDPDGQVAADEEKNAVHMHRLKLTFEDPVLESTYLESLKRDFYRAAIIAHIIAAFFGVMAVLFVKRPKSQLSLGVVEDPISLVFHLNTCFMVWSTLSLLVLLLWKRKSTGSFVKIERLMLLSCIVLSFCVCFANHYRAPLLFGVRPESVWEREYFSDSTTLISLDSIITAVHLFIQLRCCVSWLIPVAAVVLYGGLTLAVGGPEMDNMSFFEGFRLMLFLALLGIFAWFGRRAIERQARLAFVKNQNLREAAMRAAKLAVEERVLRFEAEREVDVARGTGHPIAGQGQATYSEPGRVEPFDVVHQLPDYPGLKKPHNQRKHTSESKRSSGTPRQIGSGANSTYFAPRTWAMLESEVFNSKALKPTLLTSLQAGDRILALDTQPASGNSPIPVIVPVVKVAPMFKESSLSTGLQMPQLNLELDLGDGQDPFQTYLELQTVVRADWQACKADCLGLGDRVLGIRLTSAAMPLEQMKCSQFQVLAKSVDKSTQVSGASHVRECGTQLALQSPARFLALLYFETARESNGSIDTRVLGRRADVAALNVPYLLACYVESDSSQSDTQSLTGTFVSTSSSSSTLHHDSL